MILAEQLFRITMSARLIFAGEVQINIRRLIAVKTQKRFKRNIMSVTVHLGAALGAVLGRQIKA